MLNEDLFSSFTKLRSPALMSSFLNFHRSIVLSPWISDFPPGAVKCEEINTRKWNVMQLIVAPFTMREKIDNFYIQKGGILNAKMKHLQDWFYSGLLLTSQMPHQISANIGKYRGFGCEGIFGSTEYTADSTFCDSGQTTSAPLVPGPRPSIHNTHTQDLDKSGALVCKFGVRDTWGHWIKIPKFDAMNAIKKVGN